MERVPASAGDLIVAAAIDRGGRVVEASTAIAPAIAPAISVREDETMTVFVIASTDLVDPQGAPLDAAMIAGARATDASAPSASSSGCGRCLFSASTRPQPVFAGDRCPIPRFARAFQDGIEVANPTDPPHAKVALEWPGDCACPLAQRDADPNYTWSLIDPAGSDFPERIAVSTDGTTAIFTERRSQLFTATGQMLAEKTALFEGPILSATGLPAGHFAVVSHKLGTPADAELKIFDATLTLTAAITELPLRPEAVRYLETEDLLLIFGSSTDRGPATRACTRDLDCRDLTFENRQNAGDTIYDGVLLANGSFVLFGTVGIEIYDSLPRPNTPPPSSRSIRVIYKDANGIDRPDARPRSAIAAGNRVITCAADGSAYLATATITTGIPPSFITTAKQTGRECKGFARVPSNPTATLALFDGPTALELDANGEVTATHEDYRLPNTGRHPARIDSPVAGFTIALGLAGDVHLRDDRAPTPAFRAIRGPENTDAAPIIAVLPAGDRFLALSGSGELREVARDGAIIARRTIALPEVTIDAAIQSGEDLVLAAHDRARDASLLQLDLDTATVEAIALPIALRDQLIRAIAPAGPDRLVIAAEDAKLFVLDRAADPPRVEDVEIDWDDPTTTEAEIEPNADDEDCFFEALDPARFRRDVWRDLDPYDGIVWAAGCRGDVVRIHALADPPIATRYFLGRDTQTLYAPGVDQLPALNAIRAMCPDQAYVATRGRGSDENERGRLWKIAGDQLENGGDLTGASTRLSSGIPRDLIGRRHLIVLFGRGPSSGGSLHVLGDPDRVRIGDGFTRAAELDEDTILAGSDTGRLYLGVRR